jgi:type I site-specific restriction-modification system R (restriction) subunit
MRCGANASENLEMYYDTQILSEKLIDYFEENYKNYTFVDFYDKAFVDNFKTLVKDQEKFKAFLKEISFTFDEFINIAVYICPHCFTTNLIKFLKKNYIGKLE